MWYTEFVEKRYREDGEPEDYESDNYKDWNRKSESNLRIHIVK